jgi:hypothetical protein
MITEVGYHLYDLFFSHRVDLPISKKLPDLTYFPSIYKWYFVYLSNLQRIDNIISYNLLRNCLA